MDIFGHVALAGLEGLQDGVHVVYAFRRMALLHEAADRPACPREDLRVVLVAEVADTVVRVQHVARELGRAVAGHGERQLVAAHALAVVGDADQALAAAGGDDVDPLRTGIERVLHQLLHHRRRPLHHLAGGDLVDQVVREDADAPRHQAPRRVSSA